MDDLLHVINQGRFKAMKTSDSFVYKSPEIGHHLVVPSKRLGHFELDFNT
jgi:hypothetical protein